MMAASSSTKAGSKDASLSCALPTSGVPIAGRERLAGGAGSDVFVFDAFGPANHDSIEDFNPLDDEFLLDSSAFVGLPAAGSLSDIAFVVARHSLEDSDRIIYDAGTGDLRFDVDGAGGAAAVKFAAVDPSTLLTAEDSRRAARGARRLRRPVRAPASMGLASPVSPEAHNQTRLCCSGSWRCVCCGIAPPARPP
jgi:hypothetical protein